ncbi:hypothetical protein KUCAC02_001235, partial [Chaenocephalus aceratus]
SESPLRAVKLQQSTRGSIGRKPALIVLMSLFGEALISPSASPQRHERPENRVKGVIKCAEEQPWIKCRRVGVLRWRQSSGFSSSQAVLLEGKGGSCVYSPGPGHVMQLCIRYANCYNRSTDVDRSTDAETADTDAEVTPANRSTDAEVDRSTDAEVTLNLLNAVPFFRVYTTSLACPFFPGGGTAARPSVQEVEGPSVVAAAALALPTSVVVGELGAQEMGCHGAWLLAIILAS